MLSISGLLILALVWIQNTGRIVDTPFRIALLVIFPLIAIASGVYVYLQKPYNNAITLVFPPLLMLANFIATFTIGYGSFDARPAGFTEITMLSTIAIVAVFGLGLIDLAEEVV